jgi:two-component sensor histidine kinase
LILANKYIGLYPPVDDDEKVNIAELYATCYEAMHENKLAEKYYLQEIEFSKGNPSQEQSARSALARFYSSTKQFKKNIYYLKNAGKPKESAPFMNRVFEELQYARIDSANGNYLSAFNHYRQYKALTDTMFEESNAKQLYALDVKYESKEKEQAIKLLKSEGKNQRADLQKANLQKNITFTGIGVLILLSSLIAYGYAQKQRGNRILLYQKTEIDRKNQSLEQLNINQERLLTEKEWLLKEIHHRVKNNMQVTMSLLAIQTHATTSKVAKEALANGQRRLHSMSLIHQKLYQSEKLSFIEMSNYISEMVSYLKDSFSSTNHILFKIDAQRLELDIAQAVPIGLILNEAITNGIKHAFPGDREGEIKITLTSNDDGFNQLIIADNGVGLPCEPEKLETKSLGMEIFKMLTKQIDGELCINGKDGTTIAIRFKSMTVLV